MRYFESKEQSAEILRLILPLMARQNAAYHPMSYALWYEHTAGINPSLARSLDERLSSNAPLTESEVRQLYARHIAGRDNEATERLQSELRGLLNDTAHSATHASKEAADFSDAIQLRASRLSGEADVTVVRSVVDELLVGAHRMQSVARDLAETLTARAKEVDQLSERLEQAQREALLDPLTGLTNRRGFERAIAQLDERGLAGSALLVADIDHFKAINDTHGHVLGDKVIRAVAHVLRSNIKGRDIAVRLGGEEFAVLLPDTSLTGAASLAEQIRKLVAQGRIRRAHSDEYIGHVTVSLGVAAAEAGDTLEELIERADGALYAAKRAGRNRVSIAARRDS